MTCDPWLVTRDLWPVACDPVACNTWHVTCVWSGLQCLVKTGLELGSVLIEEHLNVQVHAEDKNIQGFMQMKISI